MRAFWFVAGFTVAAGLAVVLDLYEGPPARRDDPPGARVDVPADGRMTAAPPATPPSLLARTRAGARADAPPPRAPARRAAAQHDVTWRAPALDAWDPTIADGAGDGHVAAEPAGGVHARLPPRDRGLELGVAVGAGHEQLLRGSDATLDGRARALDVRLLVAPRGRLGGELGYVGAAYADQIVSTFELVGRWQLYPGRPARPFVFVGAAWRHQHESGRDTFALPLGAGLSYTRGSLYTDARLTVRPTPGRDHHTAGVSLRVGAMF